MSGTFAAVSGGFADVSGGFADVSGGFADMSGGFADVSAKVFLRRKNFVVWGASPRCGFAFGGLRSKTPRLDPAHPRQGVLPRKGLEGGVAATMRSIGAGARERGAPQSPVFCGAKNAPR
jgi:hypothetical protein